MLKQQRGGNAWKDGKEGTGRFQGHLKGKRDEPLKQGRGAGCPGLELGPASVGSQWQTRMASFCPWTLWSGKRPLRHKHKTLTLAASSEVIGLAQLSVGTGDVSRVTELMVAMEHKESPGHFRSIAHHPMTPASSSSHKEPSVSPEFSKRLISPAHLESLPHL